MKNPCMDCPNIGCGVYHDKCPEYQAYRKEQEKDYILRLKKGQLRYDLDSNHYRHEKFIHKKA